MSSWHVHHIQSAREIERRLDDGHTLVVASPALIETYAVMTRLPPPRRLSPGTVMALLEANFAGAAIEVVALDPSDYRRLLGQAAVHGVAGGRTYDAVILACAIAAHADVLLTFNDRQFRSLALGAIEIVVPA